MPVDIVHPSPACLGRVIALHCSGASAGQWRGLAEALGSQYAIESPEHYGCGSTGMWSGEHAFTLADEAKRAIALIDSSEGKGSSGRPLCLSRPAHAVGVADWLLRRCLTTESSRSCMSGLRAQCEVAHTPGEAVRAKWCTSHKKSQRRKPCSTQHRSNAAIFAKPAESPPTTNRSRSVNGVIRATSSAGSKSPLGSAIGAAHNIGTKTQRRS